jgi:hypothetical protein
MPTRDKLDENYYYSCPVSIGATNYATRGRDSGTLTSTFNSSPHVWAFIPRRHADNGQSLAAAPHTHRFEDSGTRLTLYKHARRWQFRVDL